LIGKFAFNCVKTDYPVVYMDDDQQIGLQGGSDEDEMPPEMKAHMLAAFAHHAGLGPHPGMYKGPPRRKKSDPDEITDTDRQRAEEEPLEDPPVGQELSEKTMHAAQTGGADMGLGPSGMDTVSAKQQGTLQQQAATQGAVQAQQAQAAQTPVNAPAAPVGPQGVTQPLPAQRGPQPTPSATAGLPGQGMAPPAPSGPPPEEEEEGSPQ
jgi:hypothetical protein